jgi:hypothetical protein
MKAGGKQAKPKRKREKKKDGANERSAGRQGRRFTTTWRGLREGRPKLSQLAEPVSVHLLYTSGTGQQARKLTLWGTLGGREEGAYTTEDKGFAINFHHCR